MRLIHAPGVIQTVVAALIGLGVLCGLLWLVGHSAGLILRGRFEDFGRLWSPIISRTYTTAIGVAVAIVLALIALVGVAVVCYLIMVIWPTRYIVLIGFIVYLLFVGALMNWALQERDRTGPTP